MAGQYHFTYILAPKRYRRFAAFAVGIISVLGWWVITCSGISNNVQCIIGMVLFVNPDYQPQNWHSYLLYIGLILITREASPKLHVRSNHADNRSHSHLHHSPETSRKVDSSMSRDIRPRLRRRHNHDPRHERRVQPPELHHQIRWNKRLAKWRCMGHEHRQRHVRFR